MAKSSSLSDEKIIETINKHLVAIEINITDQGFPKNVAALKPWEKAFEKDRRHKYGFATSVVITPDGKFALGTSGCGHSWEWQTSINYHPDKFQKYLDECLDRFKRLEARQDLPKLREEILKQILEANRCRK